MNTTPPPDQPRQLKVWVDFICPYCMLATKPLHEAIAGLPIRIEWMPFELRPEPLPQFRTDEPFIQNGWKQSVYPLAALLGVEMRLPQISPQPYTRLAFEGLQFAKQAGKTQEYGDAVFRAYFQAGRDIGSIDVLTTIAGEVGLAADAFKTALQTGAFRDAHQEALRSAHQIGINAVPTIQIQGRLFSGVPDAAALRRALTSDLTGV